MAKTKKSTKKTANTTKAASSKTVSKKTAKVAASVKHETAAKKEGSHKNDEHKQAKHTTHAHSEKKSNKTVWIIAAVVLGVIVLILGAVAASILFFIPVSGEVTEKSGSTSGANEEVVVDTTTSTSGSVKLVVIEDPNCAVCQVDMFVQQVKENLIPDMTVEKINYESEEAKAALEKLSVPFVPVFLFSKSIDQRDDWQANLASAFAPVEVMGESYYLLNPQIVQGKVMIQDPVITDSAVVIGDENAPVTVIEFSDYECPFCAIAEGNEEMVEQFRAQNPDYTAPVPKLIEEYVETGKVKLVFYNFPIPSLHPQAQLAHLSALCANEQGSWEEYHRNLWDKRSDWIEATDKTAKFKSYASDLGLDTEQFNSCVDSGKYNDQIESEIQLGASYGVSGTPAFFVNRNFISGAQDYQTFKAFIEAELAQN